VIFLDAHRACSCLHQAAVFTVTVEVILKQTLCWKDLAEVYKTTFSESYRSDIRRISQKDDESTSSPEVLTLVVQLQISEQIH